MDTTTLVLVAVMILIVIGIVVWVNKYYLGSTFIPSNGSVSPEFKHIREGYHQDAALHRSLMIEILTSSPEDMMATEITYQKIIGTIQIMEDSLVRFLGGSAARNLGHLSKQRAELIRTYYRSLREPKCQGGGCINASDELGVITAGMMETIGQAGHLLKTSTRFDRLFNLLNMYDQEILNQARFYANHEYEISMRCSHSINEIASHLGYEFNYLMKEALEVLQT